MRFATTFWPSQTYNDEHVLALRNQFARWGHELTALGSDAPLQTGFIRWWVKLEWFAPWNKPLRPACVFDLDTFVIGDPAPFLALDPTKLWLIRQFLHRTDLGESGIFVAPDNDELCDRIWTGAQRVDTSPGRGDGQYLREFPHEFIPDVVSGIYSYKRDCRDALPADCRVCCFHGLPKPGNVEGWAKDWWQSSLNSPTKNS